MWNGRFCAPSDEPFDNSLGLDGRGEDEDFGLEQVTGNSNDRYTFRSSSLRNVALQPAFFHNGAFTLRDIRKYPDNPAARGNGRFWVNLAATLTGCNWPLVAGVRPSSLAVATSTTGLHLRLLGDLQRVIDLDPEGT